MDGKKRLLGLFFTVVLFNVWRGTMNALRIMWRKWWGFNAQAIRLSWNVLPTLKVKH